MSLGSIHLTPQLVQAVRDAVDIVDVASDYTRLKKSGRRFAGLCPLHKEKTPSFSVDPAQGLYYCFGCGSGGDAIKLYMQLSGDDFPAAIEALARRYGVPLPTRRAPRDGREPRDLEPVLVAAAEFFRRQLAKASGPLEYLRRRGISAELTASFGLGYAPPGWRNLVPALHPKFSLQDLETAGLAARSERGRGDPYDRFRNRLMFPVRAASGRLVGFGGRALDDDPAKYVNSSESAGFHKGRLLYGLDRAKRAIRETGSVLLVEGYFDVIGAVAAGLDSTVAVMGTALTAGQAKLLARFADEVTVGYDGDAAGEQAFRRAMPLLLAAGLGVRRAELGEDHDPDSLRLEAGPEALQRAVQESPDGVIRELERLTPAGVAREPRRQSAAAAAVRELLRPIPDAVLRYSYGRRAAERLGLPVEVLWRGGKTAREPGAETARAAPEARSPVRTLEDRVLQLLLAGREEPPAAADLPPEEVFMDGANRNIYRSYCDLYRGGAERPEARAVLSRLEGESAAVDRLARLLLEGPFASTSEELREALAQLRRRWRQQRLRQLATEIGEAQRAGDSDRLEHLIEEKTALSLALHGRAAEPSAGGDAPTGGRRGSDRAVRHEEPGAES